MGAPDNPSDVEVRRGVAELAARLGDRLPEVVTAISASLRDDIADCVMKHPVHDYADAPDGPGRHRDEDTDTASVPTQRR